jgi:hypothetical protein
MPFNDLEKKQIENALDKFLASVFGCHGIQTVSLRQYLTRYCPYLLPQELVCRIMLAPRIPDHADRQWLWLESLNLQWAHLKCPLCYTRHAARHEAKKVCLTDHQQDFQEFRQL